jgi:hypothetical protein
MSLAREHAEEHAEHELETPLRLRERELGHGGLLPEEDLELGDDARDEAAVDPQRVSEPLPPVVDALLALREDVRTVEIDRAGGRSARRSAARARPERAGAPQRSPGIAGCCQDPCAESSVIHDRRITATGCGVYADSRDAASSADRPTSSAPTAVSRWVRGDATPRRAGVVALERDACEDHLR